MLLQQHSTSHLIKYVYWKNNYSNNERKDLFMMILKKKEIIAASLVVLIGVAGYLNWSYQDTIRVTDGESYEEAKRLGEAQYVNSSASEDATPVSSSNYFTQAKMEKENSRSKSLEILEETANNQEFDEEIRKKAQQQILDTAKNVEKETSIENAAKAKGYKDISIYIDNGNVDIMIKKEGFSEKDAKKLKDIASSQLDIDPANIKIVEVK